MEQHPVFVKYKRNWLHQVTGFSNGYLCRMANGKARLTRSFIERVCFKLEQPEAELFLPEPEEDLLLPEPDEDLFLPEHAKAQSN